MRSVFAALVVVVLASLIVAGCNSSSGGNNGGGGSTTTTAPANKVLASGTRNIEFWAVATVTSGGSSEIMVTVPNSVLAGSVAGSSTQSITVLFKDASNPSNTVATATGSLPAGKDKWEFSGLKLVNGHYRIQFVANGLTGLPDGLATDPLAMVDANGVEKFLFVTVCNGVVYYGGSKRLPLPSGTDAPGECGDLYFRWLRNADGTYNLYFHLRGQNLNGSATLIPDWNPALTLPGIQLNNIGNDWWAATNQTVANGKHQFAVVGASNLSETGRLNLTGTLGSEFQDTLGGKQVFGAQFQDGVIFPHSVNFGSADGGVDLPPSLALAKNATFQYTVLGRFNANGTSYLVNVTRQVTTGWTSSDTSVATIDQNGRLQTLSKDGMTDVMTTYKGRLSNRSTVKVANQTLNAITVSVNGGDANPSVGNTRQMKAEGRNNDNSVSDLTNSVIWSSSAPSVAEVSATGLVTAKASGSATITATSGTISGSLVINVGSGGGSPPPPPSGVTITLTLSSTAPVGSGATWTGTISASDGQSRTYTAESSNTNAATVSVSGNTVTITAVNTINTNGNVLVGGAAKIRVNTTINSQTVRSNEVVVESLGQRGVSGALKRVYCRRAEVDANLAGSGSVMTIGDFTAPQWTVERPTIVMGIATASGNVDYYVSDPQDNPITAGATIRWDFKRQGSSNFYPIGATPNAFDIERDANGNRFLHTAPTAPNFP